MADPRSYIKDVIAYCKKHGLVKKPGGIVFTWHVEFLNTNMLQQMFFALLYCLESNDSRTDKYSSKVYKYYVDYSEKDSVKKTHTEIEQSKSTSKEACPLQSAVRCPVLTLLLSHWLFCFRVPSLDRTRMWTCLVIGWKRLRLQRRKSRRSGAKHKRQRKGILGINISNCVRRSRLPREVKRIPKALFRLSRDLSIVCSLSDPSCLYLGTGVAKEVLRWHDFQDEQDCGSDFQVGEF